MLIELKESSHSLLLILIKEKKYTASAYSRTELSLSMLVDEFLPTILCYSCCGISKTVIPILTDFKQFKDMLRTVITICYDVFAA